MTPVRALIAATVLVGLLLAGLAASDRPSERAASGKRTEVVVTLASPALALAPGSLARIAAEQRSFTRALGRDLPSARVHWRYRLVANGFSVSLPRADVAKLRGVPGVRGVFEGGYYAPMLDQSPGQIGAPALWAPPLRSLGQGMKIGIIDTGVDNTHPFFDPTGYTMPQGFPRGQTRFTNAKVIVARAFPPAGPNPPGAALAFDGAESAHGTHVAGIAAGNADTRAAGSGRTVSGVAPRAYIGNYKALVRSDTGGASPIENAAGLVAAIEAAVRDGMDVINLSLGEPEIEPSRNVVTKAIDAAAAAGVVPVVAAGNEFNEVGAGSVSSPASAESAIAVAAVEVDGAPTNAIHADFSSVGPTPLSLQLKPEVAAPGVDILSSVPGGGWSSLSGTSMASPHVAGAAALLKQRHPTWSVAQLKSALVTTGRPAETGEDSVAGPTFVGGGLISLAEADQPLFFSSASTVSFDLLEGRDYEVGRELRLTDAGGGAGSWTVSVEYLQRARGTTLDVGTQATVPGVLTLRFLVGNPAEGETSGYVTLRRGTDVRRIPFWGRAAVPQLGKQRLIPLRAPGFHSGTTAGRPALVTRYRYPEDPSGMDVTTFLRGPEAAYRVQISKRVANFGVVLTRQSPGTRVEARIVAGVDENRLTGVAALPFARNPYLPDLFEAVPAVAALMPRQGSYTVVFDSATRAGAGRFGFRFWVDDVTPPTLRIRARTVAGGSPVRVAATDRGSGVCPQLITATIDGRTARATFKRGVVSIPTSGLAAGRHRLRLRVSDYQETKNTENVPGVLRNTRTLTTTITIRG